MTAFASLIFFLFIAATAMSVVAYTNYRVDKAKNMRHKLQKYRVRVEELEDVILALDQICESRAIPRIINDEVIELYEIMMEMDPRANYLKAGHGNAIARSEELSNESAERHISRMCSSDAQIARLQAYFKESSGILRTHHTNNKISTTELQSYLEELEWLDLMVSVISNIAQGHKAYTRQDALTANAFYKKAQSEMINSGVFAMCDLYIHVYSIHRLFDSFTYCLLAGSFYAACLFVGLY